MIICIETPYGKGMILQLRDWGIPHFVRNDKSDMVEWGGRSGDSPLYNDALKGKKNSLDGESPLLPPIKKNDLSFRTK